jgi:hypothetical protein
MTFKTKIATAVTASFFILSMGTVALAQDTVTQTVLGGTTLTASIGAATLDPVTFSNVLQTNDGTLNLIVTDGRGNNAGWNVSVISTAFLPTVGTAPAIGAAGFTFDPLNHDPIVATTGVLTGVSNAGATGSLVGATVPLQASLGNGTGSYLAPLAVSLDIPAQQPVGVYQATLTVTIATGPAA